MATTKPNIPELVERMPATDQEKEAQKSPPPAGQTRPGRPVQSKFEGPDPAMAEKICDEILAGGRESLLELIGLIRDPASDDFVNYKAEYLCHCLTIHVGQPDRIKDHRMFNIALASQLDNEKLAPYTRGFLARELQWVGNRQVAKAVGGLLTDERFCDDAARTLLAINDGAVEQFRGALPKVRGRARLVILQSLAVLRDPLSAEALLKAVSDPDREIRLTGLWGLARLGATASVEVLLKAAETQEPWERIKATQACLLLAENLAANGKRAGAAKIYTHLRNTRATPKELYIRDAAAKSLKQLGVTGQFS